MAGMPNSFPFREQHATVIRVEDHAAMTEWYRDVLGLTLVKHAPEIRIAVFDLPGPSYLCLYALAEPCGYSREDAPKCLVNWRTDDIVSTHAELSHRGIECTTVQDFGSIKLMNFFDPEGTYFDVVEYTTDWLEEKL
jgi:catechol 2,3-dioxygenase-like lactoylglutathione lyase family enzyme